MRAVSRFVVAMAVAAAAVLLVPASVGTSTASASVRAALPEPGRGADPGPAVDVQALRPGALHAAQRSAVQQPLRLEERAAHAAHPRHQDDQQRPRLPAAGRHRPGHRQEGRLPDQPGGVPEHHQDRALLDRRPELRRRADRRAPALRLGEAADEQPPQRRQLAVVAPADQRPRREDRRLRQPAQLRLPLQQRLHRQHRAALQVLPVQPGRPRQERDDDRFVEHDQQRGPRAVERPVHRRQRPEPLRHVHEHVEPDGPGPPRQRPVHLRVGWLHLDLLPDAPGDQEHRQDPGRAAHHPLQRRDR